MMAVFPDLPPLTWGRLWTMWTPNPGVLVVAVALVVAYGLGVGRLRRSGVVVSGWCGLDSGGDGECHRGVCRHLEGYSHGN